MSKSKNTRKKYTRSGKKHTGGNLTEIRNRLDMRQRMAKGQPIVLRPKETQPHTTTQTEGQIQSPVITQPNIVTQTAIKNDKSTNSYAPTPRISKKPISHSVSNNSVLMNFTPSRLTRMRTKFPMQETPKNPNSQQQSITKKHTINQQLYKPDADNIDYTNIPSIKSMPSYNSVNIMNDLSEPTPKIHSTRTPTPSTRTQISSTRTPTPSTRTQISSTRTQLPSTRIQTPSTRTPTPSTRTPTPSTRTHNMLSDNAPRNSNSADNSGFNLNFGKIFSTPSALRMPNKNSGSKVSNTGKKTTINHIKDITKNAFNKFASLFTDEKPQLVGGRRKRKNKTVRKKNSNKRRGKKTRGRKTRGKKMHKR